MGRTRSIGSLQPRRGRTFSRMAEAPEVDHPARPEDPNEAQRARDVAAAVYRSDSRRVLATLIRLLGDFDLAEEAMSEAFAAALEQWHRSGIPKNPRAWLVSAGRFKAIDSLRRRTRFNAAASRLARELEDRLLDPAELQTADPQAAAIEDDRLRLVFTCCHPVLPLEAQVALTLREVCGLTTEEIAEAFLTAVPALAKRIVRAKERIREERIPYEVPSRAELPRRLDAVLRVIYLVFNEGYSASSGSSLTRAELSSEAIRLGRLLVELLPEAEALGLLALMLLQESRRSARSSAEGDLLLLDEQDRTEWDRDLIQEGAALVRQAMTGRPGPYALQAAIAAVHAEAPRAGETDWNRIVSLYNALAAIERSPVVELNRAVAIAMRDGPSAGLPLVEAIFSRGELKGYHLAHSVRADLYRRLGRTGEARAAYEAALALAQQEPERRFLLRRLAEISGRDVQNGES
jgi:RNA polymerase sigma-70 factor, ECF subfamily